jgi:hypothetical protein
MSNWTDIRDTLREAFDIDNITEEAKQDLTRSLYEKALPMAKEYISAFVDKIREQAKAEAGWCKIRDSVVLPIALEATVWLIGKLLEKTLANTTGA